MAPLQLVSSFSRVLQLQPTVLQRPLALIDKYREYVKGLKVPPKRPLNAYALFFQDTRSAVVTENPTYKVPQIGKVIGEKWRQLPDDKKNEYKAKSGEMSELYKKSKSSFISSLSADERLEMLEENRVKRHARELRRKHATEKKMQKPKSGPVSSFACFLKSRENKTKSIVEFVKELAAEWKTMSYSDKEPFQKEAETNRKVYQNALTQWETKMIQVGKLDLVRKTKPKIEKKSSV